MAKTILQIAGSLLITAVFVGMAYQSLAEHDTVHDDKIKALTSRQEVIENKVTLIQLDVATLVANQKNQIILQNERKLEQKEDTRQIMRVLERILSK